MNQTFNLTNITLSQKEINQVLQPSFNSCKYYYAHTLEMGLIMIMFFTWVKTIWELLQLKKIPGLYTSYIGIFSGILYFYITSFYLALILIFVWIVLFIIKLSLILASLQTDKDGVIKR